MYAPCLTEFVVFGWNYRPLSEAISHGTPSSLNVSFVSWMMVSAVQFLSECTIGNLLK